MYLSYSELLDPNNAADTKVEHELMKDRYSQVY